MRSKVHSAPVFSQTDKHFNLWWGCLLSPPQKLKKEGGNVLFFILWFSAIVDIIGFIMSIHYFILLDFVGVSFCAFFCLLVSLGTMFIFWCFEKKE